MFIWLLFALLVGGFALIGHQSGAIRSGVGFFGVVLGLALNAMLTPLFRSAFFGMGVKDDIVLMIIPSVAVFVIFWLIFLGLGVAAHRPVDMHFKYKSDEPTRAAFSRANQGFGLIVGLVSGICVFLSVGSFIYKYGYVTSQLSPDEGSEPAHVQYVSQMRRDMETTGWDKTFAALDSTPARFYQIADILGTLYHNPLAHGRAAAYPPFLRLSERTEFTEMAADTDYMGLLQKKPGLVALWTNPRTQGIIKTQDIMATLLETDLNDFKTYLATGNSPKYSEDKILGRWRLDVGAVINHLKRQKQNLSAVEIRRLRVALVPILSSINFAAYSDNKYKLSVTIPPPVAPVAAATTTDAAPTVDPSLAQRYGLRRGGAPAGRPAPTAQPVAAAPVKPIKIEGLGSEEGVWSRASGSYLLKPDGNASAETEVIYNDEKGRLSWIVGTGDLKVTLFFVRAG